MNFGALFIYALAIIATLIALLRRDGSLGLGINRSVVQTFVIIPRMVFALIAAGFIVKLIPTETIIANLGAEAGFRAIAIASLTGLIVPAGPVVAFALAAAFAVAGASVPALVAFITGWSVFAAHRVVIFEIPMLGLRWVRLRMLSVVLLPFLAGGFAMLLVRIP